MHAHIDAWIHLHRDMIIHTYAIDMSIHAQTS